MRSADLNCDLGEGYGAYRKGRDDELLDVVTSANIACGFHAGDPSVMRKTVELCLEKGVAIGAHPGLPDLQGFGRREMRITPQEAYDMTIYQIGALYGFVKAAGGVLHHVKPHGALYNMAAVNSELAHAIAEAVYRIEPTLVIYGLSGSELIRAGERFGLQTASEVFADRTYQEDGTLTPRSSGTALIHNEAEAAAQVLRMVRQGSVLTIKQTEIRIKADTVCIHGDGNRAVEFARKIRNTLETEGVSVRSVAVEKSF
ncbi:LamB/YcsF family protein [Ferviditalea candida]|uniref:5-oxoprolinase subunit A n=1 Tax=Ferviditalea candida TaxID=3108399 RepID=A0ABU5ZF08_9BACL|nr:5-oxoprolinase subunit PxpA [Paenibacillaceae bacterium T2]